MATLVVRKKPNGIWAHYDSVLGEFILSKMYCKSDGETFKIVEHSGSQRKQYHYSDITLYDDEAGTGPESFTSALALMTRLSLLRYVGFYQPGEISIADYVSTLPGNAITVVDGKLYSTGGGGEAINQNNVPTLTAVTYQDDPTKANLADAVNNAPSHTVDDTSVQHYLGVSNAFRNLDLPSGIRFRLLGLGKGTYGIDGSITVEAANIDIMFATALTADELGLLPNTQTIELGEIGETLIEDALNGYVGSIETGDPEEFYVLVLSLRDGVLFSYKFTGPAGTYGDAGSEWAESYMFTLIPNGNAQLTTLQSAANAGNELVDTPVIFRNGMFPDDAYTQVSDSGVESYGGFGGAYTYQSPDGYMAGDDNGVTFITPNQVELSDSNTGKSVIHRAGGSEYDDGNGNVLYVETPTEVEDTKSLKYPNENGTLATREWAQSEFGGGGGADKVSYRIQSTLTSGNITFDVPRVYGYPYEPITSNFSVNTDIEDDKKVTQLIYHQAATAPPVLGSSSQYPIIHGSYVPNVLNVIEARRGRSVSTNLAHVIEFKIYQPNPPVKANDADVMHKTGNLAETVTGQKTFTDNIKLTNGLRIENATSANNGNITIGSSTAPVTISRTQNDAPAARVINSYPNAVSGLIMDFYAHTGSGLQLKASISTHGVFTGGGLNVTGLIMLGTYTTGTEPAFVANAMFYNSTLGKMRVSGASAWETVQST